MLDRLNCQRDGVAAALTQRGHAGFCISLRHRVQQRGENPRARRPNRVACPPVEVGTEITNVKEQTNGSWGQASALVDKLPVAPARIVPFWRMQSNTSCCHHGGA